MTTPLYTRDILRLATSIPQLGLLDQFDGVADLRSPTCGSRMMVTVRLDPAGRIAAIGQQVEACAFGQASAALMGAHAVGRSRGEIENGTEVLGAWLAGTSDHPGPWPNLETLAPARSKIGRHGAILLPFRALLAAVDLVG